MDPPRYNLTMRTGLSLPSKIKEPPSRLKDSIASVSSSDGRRPKRSIGLNPTMIPHDNILDGVPTPESKTHRDSVLISRTIPKREGGGFLLAGFRGDVDSHCTPPIHITSPTPIAQAPISSSTERRLPSCRLISRGVREKYPYDIYYRIYSVGLRVHTSVYRLPWKKSSVVISLEYTWNSRYIYSNDQTLISLDVLTTNTPVFVSSCIS